MTDGKHEFMHNMKWTQGGIVLIGVRALCTLCTLYSVYCTNILIYKYDSLTSSPSPSPSFSPSSSGMILGPVPSVEFYLEYDFWSFADKIPHCDSKKADDDGSKFTKYGGNSL